MSCRVLWNKVRSYVWILGVGAELAVPVTPETVRFEPKVLVMPANGVGRKAWFLTGPKDLIDVQVSSSPSHSNRIGRSSLMWIVF